MRMRRSRIWLAGTMLSGAGLTSGAMIAPAAAQQAEATLSELSVTSASPILPAPGPSAAGGFPTGVLPVVGDSLSPVTVVTRSEIQRNQPRTLGDALSDRPGISSSTYAPGAASRPIIRGLDNARVRIQENGIVNGGVSDLGEDHAVPVNPLTADRIEVIRGPATLRYGSGAIGGVVSSENNQVPTFIPARGVSGQVTTGYSSVDNGRLGAASVDAGATYTINRRIVGRVLDERTVSARQRSFETLLALGARPWR
jgi:iron complex outermembrane receptor protein